jgi:hypothetical protein
MTMTRQPTDEEVHPRGHLVRKGSALHPHRRKTRHHGPAHDLDIMLTAAKREQRHSAGKAGKTKHSHGSHGHRRKGK